MGSCLMISSDVNSEANGNSGLYHLNILMITGNLILPLSGNKLLHSIQKKAVNWKKY